MLGVYGLAGAGLAVWWVMEFARRMATASWWAWAVTIGVLVAVALAAVLGARWVAGERAR